jgi:hypothetical protein
MGFFPEYARPSEFPDRIPKHGPAWIVLLFIGLSLFVFGDLMLLAGWGVRSGDESEIIRTALMSLGLVLGVVGVPFVVSGIVLRLRPPPVLSGGVDDPY